MIAALALGTSSAPSADASPRRRAKADAAHVVTLDLASLGIDGDPTLTLALPDDIWRAHLPLLVDYPRENQLTESAGRRVASRWLQATHADGRGFHAEIFIVVQPAELGSVRDWAQRIAAESHTIFPFEDSRFDGPWIVNTERFRLAGKKRLNGYRLENSGGRSGEDYRSVWQFALLPMPDGFNVLLGVKRRAPTTWAPGKGGPPDAGGAGIDGGSGLGETGDGSGSLPGTGGEGDGSLGDGVGGSGDIGNANTEPDQNQVRASTELFRSLVGSVYLTESTRMRKGLRRFQLRDEWTSPKGLTSRYVGVSVPATWRATPTTALRRDRLEWSERDDDGNVTALARVEFLSTRPPRSLDEYARVRFADWGVTDASLVPVETRDGTNRAALCEEALTAPGGLRAGDDRTWVREIGYVAAESTLYEVEILHPPDARSRVETLRAMLESFEIVVAY